jgi:hypothetical protein
MYLKSSWADEGYTGLSASWTFTEGDPATYTIELFSYAVEATDNIAIDHYWLMDTTYFDIDNTGLITNHTCLSVGDYLLTIVVSDAAGNDLTIVITITVESDGTTPTDTGTDSETRFDPFADDPLRNVPGYPGLMFTSLVLVSIVGLMWNNKRQKRKS